VRESFFRSVFCKLSHLLKSRKWRSKRWR